MPIRYYFYIGGAVFVAVLIWMAAPFFTVEQNQVGVVTRFGKFERLANPGLNFLIPVVNSYTTYRTDILKTCSTDLSPDLINTYTEDNQEVDISWCVFYRLPPEKIAYIFESNRDYKPNLITLTGDRVKVAFGRANVQKVAGQRGKIRDEIQTTLTNDAGPLGIHVVNFTLPNLEYGKLFRDAINQAAVQKANIERIGYEQEQERKIAETAKIRADGEANAIRSKAQGDADGIRFRADADAHRVEVAGLAEAKAIKAQTEALAQAPQLIELRKAERWNGQLPSTMLGSSPVPLISVDSLAQQQQHK